MVWGAYLPECQPCRHHQRSGKASLWRLGSDALRHFRLSLEALAGRSIGHALAEHLVFKGDVIGGPSVACLYSIEDSVESTC